MLILREIMDKKNITVPELAAQTGLKIRTIESYRYKKNEPGITSAIKIAKALNIRVEDLVSDEISE